MDPSTVSLTVWPSGARPQGYSLLKCGIYTIWEATGPMLENIRVVLIRPFHPGNIGSSARAMKTMGLSRLTLVNPKQFPDAEADRLAAGATDVLETTEVVSSLHEAVADCQMVIASTARIRGYDLPALTPEQCANELVKHAEQGPVALLFGPERFGVSNDDFALARARVTIPANSNYSSLNLASSVQILCYEICKHVSGKVRAEEPTPELPTSQELEYFYEHLERTFLDTGFINRSHQGEIMQRLRHLYSKAGPNKMEINILRGMLASIDRKISHD